MLYYISRYLEYPPAYDISRASLNILVVLARVSHLVLLDQRLVMPLSSNVRVIRSNKQDEYRYIHASAVHSA
jgi:hypothetical protein